MSGGSYVRSSSLFHPFTHTKSPSQHISVRKGEVVRRGHSSGGLCPAGALVHPAPSFHLHHKHANGNLCYCGFN